MSRFNLNRSFGEGVVFVTETGEVVRLKLEKAAKGKVRLAVEGQAPVRLLSAEAFAKLEKAHDGVARLRFPAPKQNRMPGVASPEGINPPVAAGP